MSHRRALLEDLFRRLEDRQIPYCVQRNYAAVFEQTDSDVDLLVLRKHFEAFQACCNAAADATGFRLIQKTRFINHSLVYWNGAACFVRIDVDTELRWRRHHLLTSEEILDARKKAGGFHVPDPRHECVILLAQGLWRGTLSARYSARLVELQSLITDKQSLNAILERVFDGRNLSESLLDRNLPARLRNRVRRTTLLQPSRAIRSAQYALADIGRLFNRLRSPPGIALRLIGASEADLNQLRDSLSVAFPRQKSFVHAGKADESEVQRTLFKGGLAIESWPASQRPGPVLRRWFLPERSFGAFRENDENSHFLHVSTGWMQSASDFAQGMATFICATLAERSADRPRGKGGFVIFVGLDGSGKTTLARNLAVMIGNEKCFAGVRYFHWIPSARETFEFPLPEGNQPRHREAGSGFFAALTSAARLVKNLLRARIAYHFRLRPLMDQGYLVMVDRYFYNYYLDPRSVKYAGPAWLLKIAQQAFPQPDIIVALRAPPEVLLRRKQELSEAEIMRQATSLDELKFKARRVIKADGMSPARDLAEKMLSEIKNFLNE